MVIPTILAHGALGPWDELMFLGVGVIFLVMMGISWVKSRNMTPTLDEPDPAESNTETESPDHVRLE